jgi:hypothetical protein
MQTVWLGCVGQVLRCHVHGLHVHYLPFCHVATEPLGHHLNTICTTLVHHLSFHPPQQVEAIGTLAAWGCHVHGLNVHHLPCPTPPTAAGGGYWSAGSSGEEEDGTDQSHSPAARAKLTWEKGDNRVFKVRKLAVHIHLHEEALQ